MDILSSFVNGSFLNSEGSQDVWDKICPSTGETSYQLCLASPMDLVGAIQVAKKSSQQWLKQSVEVRVEWLQKFKVFLEEEQEKIVALEAEDEGIPYSYCREMSVGRLISFINYAESFFKDRLQSLSPKASLSPLGLVSILGPSILSSGSVGIRVVSALMTGNVIICKPSRHSSRSVLLLAELMVKAGLPHGVLNVLLGRGNDLGQLLVSHPGVDAVVFIGKSVNGRSVLQKTSLKMKPTFLALEGKNTAAILKDASVDKHIANLARATLGAGGRLPWSQSRILVQEDLLEELLEKLSHYVKSWRITSPDQGGEISCLLSGEHKRRVLKYLEQAEGEKARLIELSLNSDEREGFWVSPHLLVDLPMCSELQQEELLAPVVLVNTFKYQYEVIKWLEALPQGLCASIWGEDEEKLLKVASGLPVGRVWINQWMSKEDWSLPMQGLRSSGLGSDGGESFFRFFESQTGIFN